MKVRMQPITKMTIQNDLEIWLSEFLVWVRPPTLVNFANHFKTEVDELLDFELSFESAMICSFICEKDGSVKPIKPNVYLPYEKLHRLRL
jgi:hypothetical protein